MRRAYRLEVAQRYEGRDHYWTLHLVRPRTEQALDPWWISHGPDGGPVQLSVSPEEAAELPPGSTLLVLVLGPEEREIGP